MPRTHVRASRSFMYSVGVTQPCICSTTSEYNVAQLDPMRDEKLSDVVIGPVPTPEYGRHAGRRYPSFSAAASFAGFASFNGLPFWSYALKL